MKPATHVSLSLALSLLWAVNTCCPARPADDAGDPASDNKPLQSLHGYVSTTQSQDEIAGSIDEALSTAIQKSIEAQKSNKQVTKYNRLVQGAWKQTKAMVNYCLADRGFLPSIEGGQLMLDEHVKVHDKYSAEYAKQQWLDHMHDQVVGDIVELVTALGTDDPALRKQRIAATMDSLKSYTDNDVAKHIYDRLAAWSEKQAIQQATMSFNRDQQWSVKERQAKLSMIVNTVCKDDPIVSEVTNRVHRYSKHGKVATVSSQFVESTLSLVSLTPSFVGPAAQAALLVFFTATGGPEEDKLVSEMYLGKRFQSRRTSLSNQATMALDAYQLALATHNVPLMACSNALIRRLGGESLLSNLLSKPSAVPVSSADSPKQTEPPAAATTMEVKAEKPQTTDTAAVVQPILQ